MSEIFLRAADARAVAGDVQAAAIESTDQFARLRARLGDLVDSFRGQTAMAFDDRYNEWADSATQLIEALDGLGAFLSAAATGIEETDASLAAGLRG